MDFRVSEDQASLQNGVREFLAGTCGSAVLRQLDGTKTGRSADIWRGLVEMGLPGLLVPEAQGGMGLGLVEAVLIAVECGRVALAEPLVDTAFVAVPVLAAAGANRDLLAVIASGDAKIALQHPVNPWIADLDGATHLLTATEESLTVTPAPEARPMQSVDPLRRLSAPISVSGTEVAVEPARLLDLATLMSAAQLVGIAEAMLAASTEYAKIRTQFGQPIGGFQAVKHHLASAAVAIEFARPVLYRAAAALEEVAPEDRAGMASTAVSHAKLAAGDAAWAMSETAIQVHGAMGYTYEVDLHYWMKRAWALANAWGDRAFHLARIDAAVIGGAVPIGPGHTFS